MEDCAGPDVALADFDDPQLVSFELDYQAVEGLGHGGWLGNPVSEHRRPLLRFSLRRLTDVVHNRGGRHRPAVSVRRSQLINQNPVQSTWRPMSSSTDTEALCPDKAAYDTNVPPKRRWWASSRAERPPTESTTMSSSDR